MTKKLPWILTAFLMLGVAVLATATAHTPEEHEPAGPSQRLSIIAAQPPKDEPYEPEPYYQDMLLDLSTDAADTAEPSKSYTFEYSLLPGSCNTPLVYPYCSNDRYAQDDLVNIGEDFQIVPSSLLVGNLHFAYEYDQSGIDVSSSDVIGWIDASLQIGEYWYAADSIPLGPEGGEFNVTLDFHWYPSCEYDYENDTETCQDEVDDAPENSTAELWGHDLTMALLIQGPYSPLHDVTWSERLDIKLDTAGGSFVDVPKVVPIAVASAIDDTLVSVGHDDLDGDGVLAEPQPISAEQNEDGQIVYSPGPAVPLLALATLGLAILVRRRLG